ncbi:citramalate synthase [Acidianus sulfidivorans JP7]|uniref:Citramalate synthase n=1 Tax=Acidianus sulfidivorans JP7 TaxID=619593 RepID=A0A2U9ILR2_9CREN|nr:citramalate synthase [Acidianus sulfidivorans]AWR96999.1 citramalate synthase [Acidianus sulfidivorans JP7]
MKKLVETLDTTLRDGAQTTSVSFTLNDKIKIALALDDLGITYIEGGWPSSNPKDYEFFKEIKNYNLKAKIAAFSSTRKKDTKPYNDPNLNSILEAEVKTAVLFGKSWTLHVTEILKTTKEENLELIYDSIKYLKDHGLEVIFDAEHFYQGYKDDRDYALQVVKTAEEAGASVIALADTNGGTLPNEVFQITKDVIEHTKAKIGLHMHNDSGCAVANSIMGILAGARHVQGTINGLGERTGNADLVQIIPNLQLKLGFKVLEDKNLTKLKYISKLVYELSGVHPNPYQPYVGDNAFSHKAGVHADAVIKNPRAYEHINPELVGNSRKIVISELSGSSNLLNYLEKLGLKLDKKDERLKRALKKIKELENKGYSFDLAPASAVLIVLKELGLYKKLIDFEYWKVINENNLALALVKINSQLQASEGLGPVHALDMAIRNALQKVYPEISEVTLTDYRVVLPGEIKNTESLVRVTIEFSNGKDTWRTEGVSTSVIEASVMALVEGLDYYLQLKALQFMTDMQNTLR